MGALDPEGRQRVGPEVPGERALEAIAEHGNRMGQGSTGQVEPGCLHHLPRLERHQLDPQVEVDERARQEGVEIPLTRRRVVQRNGRVRGERPRLEQAGQPETVIAVEVGDADPGHQRGGQPGEQELSLATLARVEQHQLILPTQDVTPLTAGPGG